MISCNNIERLDTSKVKKQIDAYKIKKVTESEVLVVLNDKGKVLEDLLLKLDCTERNQKLDSLGNSDELRLEKVFPETYKALNDKEKEVIEALAYSLKQKQVFNSTPQKLSETEYAYYFSGNSALCKDSIAEGEFFWRALFQKAILVNSIK